MSKKIPDYFIIKYVMTEFEDACQRDLWGCLMFARRHRKRRWEATDIKFMTEPGAIIIGTIIEITHSEAVAIRLQAR